MPHIVVSSQRQVLYHIRARQTRRDVVVPVVATAARSATVATRVTADSLCCLHSLSATRPWCPRQPVLRVSPHVSYDTCLDRLAEADPVFFRDFRVLDNLLDSEPRYIPRCNYFNEVQPDLKPFMRKVVSTWMMEPTSVVSTRDVHTRTVAGAVFHIHCKRTPGRNCYVVGVDESLPVFGSE
ncbi:hypothetical protein J6590_080321 [Homalodisca vitripennis]|nr:hypothetical protein J6590_080321 [Homalodisca vitripennis]